MTIVLICQALLSLYPQDHVSADQFGRLVEAQSASLRDLCFLYEGANRWVGPRSLFGKDPDLYGAQYQGAYLYRRNDAAMKDVYLKPHNNASQMSRLKVAFLKAGIRQSRLLPGEIPPRGPSTQPPIMPGNMYSLGRYGSPNHLFRIWMLLDIAKFQATDYRFSGWDSIDGHRCLKFRLIASGKRDNEGCYDEFWVDLDRNANVLRVEGYDGNKLRSRIDEVQLKPVLSPEGTEIWVPIRSRLRGYVWEDVHYNDPVTEDLIEVVDGTILLNQGLPDAVFDVRRETTLPQLGELDRIRRLAGDSALANDFDATPQTSIRLDPAGVRQRLDKSLAEADRQAVMLEASAPSRAPWSGTGISQIVAFFAGACLIACAFVLRRRTR